MSTPSPSPSPTEMYATVSLVSLCASHINSLERLHTLNTMLESWYEQHHPIPLYLSISSSSDADCVNGMNQLVKRWRRRMKSKPRAKRLLHIRCRDQPHQQFQHYKLLVDELEKESKKTTATTNNEQAHANADNKSNSIDTANVNPSSNPNSDSKYNAQLSPSPSVILSTTTNTKQDNGNTWVIFTDDDDTWNINRSVRYCYFIYMFLTRYLRTNAIPIHARFIPEDKDIKDMDNYVGEYFDYAVPFSVLVAFFRSCSPALLANPFCDMYLVRFLQFKVPNSNFQEGVQVIDMEKLYKRGGLTDNGSLQNRLGALWMRQLIAECGTDKNPDAEWDAIMIRDFMVQYSRAIKPIPNNELWDWFLSNQKTIHMWKGALDQFQKCYTKSRFDRLMKANKFQLALTAPIRTILLD